MRNLDRAVRLMGFILFQTGDLILTTESDRICEIQVEGPLPRCGHSPVLCVYTFQMSADCGVNSDGSCRKLWFKGDYAALSRELELVDWDFELEILNVDQMFLRFREIVLELVDLFVPVSDGKILRANTRFRPPSHLIRQRKILWSAYKQARRDFGRCSLGARDALDRYQRVNCEYRNFSVKQQISFEGRLVGLIRDQPKKFHQYIRSKKVGRPSVGPLRLSSGKISGDFQEMASEFANSYSSVYFTEPLPFPFPHQKCELRMRDIVFSPCDVDDVLASLDGSSSMGPDGIHPLLLKSCSSSLSYPLYKIFQDSLRQMTLPSWWKTSLVVPLFKKGSRSDPLNYRPISLTSVCCKSLERILARSLMEYLESSLLLSEDQFSFRDGRSTEDQLLLTYDYVASAVEDSLSVFLVLFDFSKAFDVVDHRVLLQKLSLLGVASSVLGWIADFVVGREMKVVVGGRSSSGREVKSGVPQGSVLGPLLFLVFINFVSPGVYSYCKLFADDLKLVMKVRVSPGSLTLSDLSRYQDDIDLVYDTARSWGLSMNSDKCAVIRFGRAGRVMDFMNCVGFTMGGNPIKSVVSAVDLGVTVDSSLKFHDHIATVASKAGGLATNLLRSTLNREPSFMVSLFISHVRPIIDYCSCVWNTGYAADIRRLESVQRRWTRQVDGLQGLDYGRRLTILNLYSIKGRLLRSDIIKYWKIFHGKCAIMPRDIFVPPPSERTRGHPFKIGVSRCELECRRRSFSQRCVGVWNSLPQDVVMCESLPIFKSHIHRLLARELFEFA